MTSRDFCFWLQGFFEIQKPESMTAEQVDMVKKHLALVFVHEIDPSMGDKIHQDLLNSIHSPEQHELSKLKEKVEKLEKRPSYRPDLPMRC